MNLKKQEDIARSVLGREITNDQMRISSRDIKSIAPVLVRYFEWIGNLFRADLGNSIATGRPMSADVFTRLQRSLTLAGIAALIGVTGGILFGVFLAQRMRLQLRRDASGGRLDAGIPDAWRSTSCSSCGSVGFPPNRR